MHKTLLPSTKIELERLYVPDEVVFQQVIWITGELFHSRWNLYRQLIQNVMYYFGSLLEVVPKQDSSIQHTCKIGRYQSTRGVDQIEHVKLTTEQLSETMLFELWGYVFYSTSGCTIIQTRMYENFCTTTLGRRIVICTSNCVCKWWAELPSYFYTKITNSFKHKLPEPLDLCSLNICEVNMDRFI